VCDREREKGEFEILSIINDDYPIPLQPQQYDEADAEIMS